LASKILASERNYHPSYHLRPSISARDLDLRNLALQGTSGVAGISNTQIIFKNEKGPAEITIKYGKVVSGGCDGISGSNRAGSDHFVLLKSGRSRPQ
jgi:hypothetical protein